MTSGRTYRYAVALSAASAGLGMGRELVLLAILGLGQRADGLQYALSITYTISLLGDAVRLASLNQLHRGVRRPAGVPLAAGVALASLLVTALYLRSRPGELAPWLLGTAGAAGLANLAFAGILPHFQFRAPFLRVHAVTTLPNILIFLGLGILVMVGGGASPWLVPGVVLLFLAAPLLQLAALGILAGRLEEIPQRAPESIGAEGGRLALHGAGAVGAQGAQYLVRTALLAAAPGALTAFSLSLRVLETVRAILVDTFIATQIRTWAGGKGAVPALPLRWLLRNGPLAGLVVAGALVVWGTRDATGPMLAAIAALLLIGMYPSVAVRIGYALANTALAPLGLITGYALIELAALAGVWVLKDLIHGLPLGPVWLVYVLKPAVSLGVLGLHSVPRAAD